ncbi:family 1 glycosylhydrolase [Deinococcus oregonensis]|uniref:dTDP-4-dehydrorhamnose reductase n=1 Tax=Deinococcus oregonensis TaxID=1805970 RepID=A0ABV6AUG6_9DEIO
MEAHHSAVQPAPLELWLGVECTLNRVNDSYLNQLGTSGHDRRVQDLDQFAQLGARRIRYPVLWEQVAPDAAAPDWRWTDERLGRLQELGLMPIATLLHHGSGPRFTSLLDPHFPEQLADYARQVAERYPWLPAYTPVNEPLTTARFSGLYGIWYPHHHSDHSFVRALLNECRGTVLAMQAIRAVNPHAELIQTDDLGKAHATPTMQAEADFQNERRWLAYDLLCGRVDEQHALWAYLRASGASAEELHWFLEHRCPPDVIGVDYYVTSERFLDERLELYLPQHRNANHADVEAVRVYQTPAGIAQLLREAWARYGLPLAVTEAHLGSTREEQLRWFETFWQAAEQVRAEGADVRAVTSWAVLGSFDWNTLHTQLQGHYEPGAFDVRSTPPRPTALAKLLQTRAAGHTPEHPSLDTPGFWERPERFLYPPVGLPQLRSEVPRPARPLLILGQGELGQAVAGICAHRGLAHCVVSSAELAATEASAGTLLKLHRPWAVIYTPGYSASGYSANGTRTQRADHLTQQFWQARTLGLAQWAAACAEQNLPLLTFSSDQVFAGSSSVPYQEHDAPSPINAYGRAHLAAERQVLAAHPGALIVRSSALFGLLSVDRLLGQALQTLASGGSVPLDQDHRFSPTYLPDLIHTSLDLLIDGEVGVWHLVNRGESTWAELVQTLAQAAGVPHHRIRPTAGHDLGWPAPRPRYSALHSFRGQLLLSLDHALNRYLGDPQNGLSPFL